MKHKQLSVWLKMIIVFCGIFGWLFCIYIGPEIGRLFFLNSDSLKALFDPLIIFIWITGIPFFIALFLGWQICSDIGTDQAFTVKNADRLKRISALSMIECILYIVAFFYTFPVGSEYTIVLFVVLLVLLFAVIILVFTSMLSYLFRTASEIKQDNDLTI